MKLWQFAKWLVFREADESKQLTFETFPKIQWYQFIDSAIQVINSHKKWFWKENREIFDSLWSGWQQSLKKVPTILLLAK